MFLMGVAGCLAPERDAEAPQGPLPVGWLDAGARRMIQTESGVLALDRDGADGLRGAGSGIGPDDVRRVLPPLLREGSRSVGGDALRIDWRDAEGAAWRAEIRRLEGAAVLAALSRN